MNEKRYSMKENSQGWDMYDSDEDCYLNTDECVSALNDYSAEVKIQAEKMNEQAAEIELLKKLRKQDKEMKG